MSKRGMAPVGLWPLQARIRDYFAEPQDIRLSFRGILLDWIMEVHSKFRMASSVLFLAVGLIDRYLACAKVSRGDLQLVGATCTCVMPGIPHPASRIRSCHEAGLYTPPSCRQVCSLQASLTRYTRLP